MKNLIILLFLLATIQINAAIYYIDSSITDTNVASATPDFTTYNPVTFATTGGSASVFKTVEDVNAKTKLAGDQFLFRKGQTWSGTTLIIGQSGTSGNPITYGSYGSGANPIITGLATVSGWTNEGSGIYSKIITATDVNILTIDGVQYGMGRFPDDSYNTYESHVTNTTITDTGLGSATNWTGAELVLRKNAWRLDRYAITGHSGDVITYTSANGEAGTNGYGYFIQKDLRTLTTYGEWYYNLAATKLYVYFGGVDPTTKTVKIATVDYLVTNNGKDYITIDGISFVGSNKSALYLNGYYDDYLIIKNCGIDLAGQEGIYMEACRYTLTDNNTINRTSKSGIYTQGGTDNTITNNTIKNIGLILGLATSSTGSVGIFCHSQAGALVQYNSIDSVAYNGISFPYCTGSSIRNNLVNHPLQKICDGGGIYMNGEGTDGIVDGNIVLNVAGNLDGTPLTNSANGGIYLDESATNYTITNNTIAYCNNDGIKLHLAFGNTVSYNVCFANDYGIGEEEYQTGTNVLTYNQFIARSTTQYAMKTEISPIMVVADYNYYARPIDDTNTIKWWTTYYEERTFEQWKTATNQDLHSQKWPYSPITSENEIQLMYNLEKTSQNIPVFGIWKDLSGNVYDQLIPVESFKSKVVSYVGASTTLIIRTKGLSAGGGRMWKDPISGVPLGN